DVMESISFKTYLLGRQLAAAPAVDDILPILQGGIDVKKIKWSDFLIAAANYCEDTGVVNALVAVCSTNFTTYERLPYLVKVANNNTGACTLSLNNMAPKPIKKKGLKDLDEGDLIAGQIIMVVDGGENYQMISPTASTKDWHYAVTTGNNNAYALALTPALDAYKPGMPIIFKANFTNTDAVTMDINGIGAVAIKVDGSDLEYGHIRKDGIYTVIYNGSVLILVNPSEPVGSIIYRLSSTVIPGRLKFNGTTISRTTYADLWAWAYAKSAVVSEASWAADSWGSFGAGDGATTFRLPEFRGEFARYFDDSRGIDSGRVMGKWAADQLKLHNHLTWDSNKYDAVSSGVGGAIALYAAGSSYGYVTGQTGGTETRPRSITIVPFIKW
ncbi:MAG: phage tail protein, partial [Smithella sp.]